MARHSERWIALLVLGVVLIAKGREVTKAGALLGSSLRNCCWDFEKSSALVLRPSIHRRYYDLTLSLDEVYARRSLPLTARAGSCVDVLPSCRWLI